MERCCPTIEQQNQCSVEKSALDPNFYEIVGLLVGHALSDVERSLICATLARYNGNKTHAAKVLGISVRGLRYKTNG
jgi:DNA-binding NtrC family response regulator